MSYTEETSHPSPVFHFHWFNFSWFVCMCAYTQAEQYVWVRVLWWAVLWQCIFFLSLSDRCLWSFLPWVHLPSSVSTRGEVQQPFWPYYAYARSHLCTYTRGSFAVLLFVVCQESALARGWPSREIEKKSWLSSLLYIIEPCEIIHIKIEPLGIDLDVDRLCVHVIRVGNHRKTILVP